jgi:prepilin-type N-terminal cleavage/methylation domain-containing protein
MNGRFHQLRADRGDTLIEVLVTIAILGIAVVAVVGGLGTAIFMSDVHTKEATEQTIIHDYAEAIQGFQTWKGCAANASTYAPSSVGLTNYNDNASTYTVSDTVSYWNGLAFTPTCSTDTGLQEIALTVSAPPRATETLAILKRCPGVRGAGGACP